MAPPIGTPGCTGGGAGRNGALYTGRGPVCGTIMRGNGGGGGAAGRVATGALAETTGDGGTAEGGTCAAGSGVAGRAGGALTGDDAANGGAAAECAGRTGATGGAATGATGGATTGLVTTGVITGRLTTGGATTAGLSAGACVTVGAAGRGGTSGGAVAASFFCVIARKTSPGREMCDRSIFVLISSSPRGPRELDLPAEDEPSAEERMYTRTFSASCSSRELECVFFSVTPTNGSVSRIALLLTSSSRARSLIRTLLIRPFVSPRFS
jgi:hypothetical protein